VVDQHVQRDPEAIDQYVTRRPGLLRQIADRTLQTADLVER
jgi:hypothetical protein